MAKSEAIKKLLSEKKALDDSKKKIAEQEEKLGQMLAGLKEEDLDELVGPLNKQLAELDEKRKKLMAEKRSILKQFAPKSARTRSGQWKCEAEKKGKNIVLTVEHSAFKTPFVKEITNGSEEAVRKAYVGIRNSFIEHFKNVASRRASESYLTNTVRKELGIA